jgi:hypothetical protein
LEIVPSSWRHSDLMDCSSALLLCLMAVIPLLEPPVMMPAINQATNLGNRPRSKLLHGLSVIVTLIHIALAGVVISLFI